MTKTQPPSNRAGRLPKDAFNIDTQAATVTCPAHNTAPLKPTAGGGGIAVFGQACTSCALRGQCTTARAGRTIRTSAYEDELARAQQRDSEWKAAYRATRPKVERKFGHLMRHRHGGRRTVARGLAKVAADFSLLAAAHNLARLGRLGIRSLPGGGWALATG
jgi:Transposase DDE domain